MSKVNGGGNSIPQLIRRGVDALLPQAQQHQAKVDNLVERRTAGGYEVKTDDKNSLLLGRETTVKSTRGDEGNSSQSTTRFVNGRRVSSSSVSTTTDGNLSGKTTIDRAFTRSGGIGRERLTTELTTRYGDHQTIGRTQVTDGRFQSDAINYTNTEGGTTRSTTVTNSSGPQVSRTDQGDNLQYHGGEYMRGVRHSNRRWVKGRYEATHGATYDNYRRRDTQTTITRDTRAHLRGTDAEATRVEGQQRRGKIRGHVQTGLNIAGDMGLRTTLAGGERSTATAGAEWNQTTSADGRTTTETLLGPRAEATSFGEVTLGADGLKARGDASARAGLYAEARGTHETDFGTLSGSAGVRAEAFAEATGQASIGLNGLDARGHVGVGVEVSADVEGSYRLPSVTIGGQEVDAGISAHGRVAAEARAEANGRVQFTGDPPRAIVSGNAGASAVVKAEGDVKVDAGPFSLTAEGYVSAGAEAQANGVIGYDDGKLTLGFGAGAALGVGAGGRVQLTVDVKEVGRIAGGLAQEAFEATGLDRQLDRLDVTGDDNFNMEDVRVIGGAAVEAAGDAVEAVGSAVSAGVEAVGDAAEAVGSAVSNAADAVGDAVSGAADAVGSALSDGAEAVGEFFSGW